MTAAEAGFVYVEQRAGLYRAQVVQDEAISPSDAALLCFDFAETSLPALASYSRIEHQYRIRGFDTGRIGRPQFSSRNQRRSSLGE